MHSSVKHGFSIAEVLIAISMVGVLAAMLVPGITNNTNQEKLLGITQEAIYEVSRGYAQWQKVNGPPTASTTLTGIIGNMNVVRVINDGSFNIQVPNTTAPAVQAVFNSSCNATTPCALLHNGAFIQYDADQSFSGFPRPTDAPGFNINALHFFVDPDGPGSQKATGFYMFYSGRITTPFYTVDTVADPLNPGCSASANITMPVNSSTYTNAVRAGACGYAVTANPDDLPQNETDPLYIRPWTDG